MTSRILRDDPVINRMTRGVDVNLLCCKTPGGILEETLWSRSGRYRISTEAGPLDTLRMFLEKGSYSVHEPPRVESLVPLGHQDERFLQFSSQNSIPQEKIRTEREDDLAFFGG